MIYIVIIFIAVVSRFLPHVPNFAPITALAIFGAVYLPKKQAIAIPLAVRFISDLYLGFFACPLMLAVYAAHLSGSLFGLWIRKNNSVIPEAMSVSESYPESISGSRIDPNKSGLSGMIQSKWVKIILSSLGASLVFFLVTNFAFLYAQYPHNFAGIIQAYTAGMPFLRGTLMGDMTYTLALFGAYEFAQSFVKNKQFAKNLQV